MKKGDLKELLFRMDMVPVSIALAQAAKESGWGTSRFALRVMPYLVNGLGMDKVSPL